MHVLSWGAPSQCWVEEMWYVLSVYHCPQGSDQEESEEAGGAKDAGGGVSDEEGTEANTGAAAQLLLQLQVGMGS